MDDKIITGGTVGAILSVAGTGLSATEAQQIVSMACTVLGLLITIVTAVFIPIWKEIRAAKKDGKITPEEMEDIANTAKDGVDKIKDAVDKINEEKKDNDEGDQG